MPADGLDRAEDEERISSLLLHRHKHLVDLATETTGSVIGCFLYILFTQHFVIYIVSGHYQVKAEVYCPHPPGLSRALECTGYLF